MRGVKSELENLLGYRIKGSSSNTKGGWLLTKEPVYMMVKHLLSKYKTMRKNDRGRGKKANYYKFNTHFILEKKILSYFIILKMSVKKFCILNCNPFILLNYAEENTIPANRSLKISFRTSAKPHPIYQRPETYYELLG